MGSHIRETLRTIWFSSDATSACLAAGVVVSDASRIRQGTPRHLAISNVSGCMLAAAF